MKLRMLMVGVALAALMLPAAAQDKPVQLKISHWVPATHPLQKAAEEWGASLEKASGGTIKSTVFPSQQLGKAFDHYDMVRDGIADVGYINPGYQPGRFPIVSLGEIPFLVGEVHGGIRAVDQWYRKYAPTEMKDVKLLLLVHPRSGDVAFEQEEDPGARRHQGHEDPSVAGHDRVLGHAARRHQRAGERNRSPRRDGEGRRRGGDVPVGIGAAVGRRQGHEVSHGCGDLDDHVPVADQPESLRRHVGGAEKGDRRSLHHRLGQQVRRPVGRFRARRRRQVEGDGGPRGLLRSRRRNSTNGSRRPSRCSRCGPTTSARSAATRIRS